MRPPASTPLSQQKPLQINDARIVDPANGVDARGAVLIEDGLIVDIALEQTPDIGADTVLIDAKGMLLCPGLIDTRVFTGEPGHEYRETLSSAAQAAAAGGVTSFVSMPDTAPVVDDSSLVEFVKRRAETEALVNIWPSAALTKGLNGHEITEYGLLKEAGAVCLTDGKNAIQSNAVLRAAFTYASNFDMPVIHQPTDSSLLGDGVMNEGLFATTLGLPGIPLEAETIPLDRDVQLAQLTGARYHAAQISCDRSVQIMARAKQNHANLSAGISINNLNLNELDVGQYRTFFKLAPPLRAEQDRLAVIEGLKTGIIDIIHSGHDPQDVEVKRRPFAEAADGAIGLETLLAAALRLFHEGAVPLTTILAALTSRPAQILGLPGGSLAKGAPADFILVDLDYPWVATEQTIRSRSQNTTFEGGRFMGKVMATYVAGNKVFAHDY